MIRTSATENQSYTNKLFLKQIHFSLIVFYTYVYDEENDIVFQHFWGQFNSLYSGYVYYCLLNFVHIRTIPYCHEGSDHNLPNHIKTRLDQMTLKRKKMGTSDWLNVQPREGFCLFTYSFFILLLVLTVNCIGFSLSWVINVGLSK